jgi:hypothetical protein
VDPTLTRSHVKKSDFLRYAIEMKCINPIRDIITNSLPPLKGIARGVSIQLREVVKHGTQSTRDIDVALRTASIEADMFPDNSMDCEQDLALNAHLGAEEAVSPRRVQDPEGAKNLVLTYTTTAGATSAMIKRGF